MDGLWLIWSLENKAWHQNSQYKYARSKYTEKRIQAARYTLETAREIVNHANIGSHTPNEAMVPDY
jgi:hypothetical protein